ncbi:hypothetical protein V5O48_015282, partial [Marasmius crinis-equi]
MPYRIVPQGPVPAPSRTKDALVALNNTRSPSEGLVLPSTRLHINGDPVDKTLTPADDNHVATPVSFPDHLIDPVLSMLSAKPSPKPPPNSNADLVQGCKKHKHTEQEILQADTKERTQPKDLKRQRVVSSCKPQTLEG